MKTIRIILLVLTGFAALTCIGGGIALTTGMEKERIPISWLQGTPFNDYTLPGIFLAATGIVNLLAFIFIIINLGKNPRLQAKTLVSLLYAKLQER